MTLNGDYAPLLPLSERGEGIMSFGVTLCVSAEPLIYHVSTACRIILGGEGNALYPVLSSLILLPDVTNQSYEIYTRYYRPNRYLSEINNQDNFNQDSYIVVVA